MKTVLIKIITHSLGDIIGAMPVIEQFRQDNSCNVVVDCNKAFQFMFKKSYPDIKFLQDDIRYDDYKEIDYDFNSPLQTGFAKQLGYHNWKYIRPKVDIPDDPNPYIKGKYISMGIHSTLQLKYWNHPSGKSVQKVSPNWHNLGKLLKKNGHKSVIIDKHELYGAPPFLNGIPKSIKSKTEKPLSYAMNVLYYSRFFIGISSGLSWLAHALGKPVVMINNFTEEWNEFDISLPDYIKITNKSVCHACWNKINIEHKFDAGEWYWCPLHANTNRQFECHKSITPEMVYEKIKHWL